MVEAGVAGYQSTGWNGLLAPVKVSRSIVEQIASAVARVIAQPEMRDQFERQGAEARSTTPREFASFMREEWDRYAKVIKAAGITPQ